MRSTPVRSSCDSQIKSFYDFDSNNTFKKNNARLQVLLILFQIFIAPLVSLASELTVSFKYVSKMHNQAENTRQIMLLSAQISINCRSSELNCQLVLLLNQFLIIVKLRVMV